MAMDDNPLKAALDHREARMRLYVYEQTHDQIHDLAEQVRALTARVDELTVRVDKLALRSPTA